MAWSVAKGAAIGFSAVLAVLIAYALVTLHHTQRLNQQDHWVSHTYDVLGELETLISSLKDAETGQRGFVITGNEAYLEPYHTALTEYKEHENRLRALIADNPQQLERLNGIDKSATERMAGLEQVVELRRADKTDEARQVILSGVGKRLMEDIRDRVDAMETVERGLLTDRIKEARQSYVIAIASIVLGLVLTAAVLAVAWYLIRRELKARTLAMRLANEQKERLLTTLTSIGDAVIVSDAAGRVTLMNAVAERLTDWGPEATGEALSRVFHIVNEETRTIVESPVSMVLRKGTVVGLANHTLLIAKDGTELPIDDSGAPIRDEDGQIIGVVLVFRDISQRRQAERLQEELNAQLREADRNKDQFLATLSHELRNPLAPLSNALEVWPTVENNREEMERLRKMMERQVQQMIRLIDDLLDLSRITRGKVHLRQQPVEISTLINGAVEAIGPFIMRCKHRLRIEIPEQPVLVYADVARLVQVMANVLHNAAKYTSHAGQISVKAAREDGEVAIHVRDTGRGIPPEMLSHIFEMFTQVDDTVDRTHGGLGIGLTLVKNLVELHGGTVAAQSDGPGRGSEFIIRMPVLTDAASPKSPDQRSPRKGGPKFCRRGVCWWSTTWPPRPKHWA